MSFREPSFPPLLDGRAVVQGDDVRAQAIRGARAGELGAGDVLWLQDALRAELAIVLEPDTALKRAAQMLPLGVAAAGDCLASLAPPQVGVAYRWPATLLLNGAEVGHCTLTVPGEALSRGTGLDAGPDAVPDWMVLHIALRFAFDGTTEPGTTPGITSLMEEGITDLESVDVVEALARHFLALLDGWTNDGFGEVVQSWASRIDGRETDVPVQHAGGATFSARTLGLDEDGNLLIRQAGADATALALIDCIAPATVQ